MQIRQLDVPDKILFTLTQTFRYLNCCCNFFLYSATSSLFRRELREIFQCSTSSSNNQKQINAEQTGSMTRARAQSSPPTIFSSQVTESNTEKKKLLSSITKSTDMTIGENFLSTSKSIELNNGHKVSFTKWVLETGIVLLDFLLCFIYDDYSMKYCVFLCSFNKYLRSVSKENKSILERSCCSCKTDGRK